MAKISYLGHAGFIVEHADIRILIDPWFYPAFLKSWFPYPDNRFLLDSVLSGKFDYLYISHLHQDHYDERLLRSLDKSIGVIAPKYRSRELQRRLKLLGFENVTSVDHKDSMQLGRGVTATVYLDTSHKEDSGLLLDMDGLRFLDLNDCNPALSQLPDNVEILAAQYSGAMWYPNCYDYEPELMQGKVEAVRSQLLETLCAKVRTTGCKWYVPSAGPACFLDPALDKFNDRKTTIFPHWEDVSTQFASYGLNVEVLRIFPGDHVSHDVAGPTVHRTGQHTVDDLASYRNRRRNEWAEFYSGAEPQVTEEDLARYFGKLQRRNTHLLGDFRKDIRVASGGKIWGVRLGEVAKEFVIESEEPLDPEYTFILSPRTLMHIVNGKEGWEEALLSMRVSLHRDPDVFDLKLMGLLRYGNHPIQTLQMMREQTGGEMIERDGLRLQRFCPHAGEDLMFAKICNGVIECPRHHWKWDIKTGKCIEGGTIPLKISIIDPENRDQCMSKSSLSSEPKEPAD